MASHKLRIGRQVHFQSDMSRCETATVVRVWEDNVVSLHVLYDGGLLTSAGIAVCCRLETHLLQNRGAGSWHWPDECPNHL